MAATQMEKAYCVLELAKTNSVTVVHLCSVILKQDTVHHYKQGNQFMIGINVLQTVDDCVKRRVLEDLLVQKNKLIRTYHNGFVRKKID